jgi:hypothetical protein
MVPIVANDFGCSLRTSTSGDSMQTDEEMYSQMCRLRKTGRVLAVNNLDTFAESWLESKLFA